MTTKFLYDGADLIAEYDGSGVLLRRYVHGRGVDNPLVWFEGTDDTAPRYLTSDQLGSITAVTDASGNALSLNSYNEYGLPHATNAAYQGRFGYTGQVYLPEIGLYNYKNRMYAPSLGRFLQPDPIGYGDGLNVYAYVHGDPINATDPWGTTCTITAIWKQFPNKQEIVDGVPVVYVRPDKIVGYRTTGCGPGMSGPSAGSGSGGDLGTVVLVEGKKRPLRPFRQPQFDDPWENEDRYDYNEYTHEENLCYGDYLDRFWKGYDPGEAHDLFNRCMTSAYERRVARFNGKSLRKLFRRDAQPSFFGAPGFYGDPVPVPVE